MMSRLTWRQNITGRYTWQNTWQSPLRWQMIDISDFFYLEDPVTPLEFHNNTLFLLNKNILCELCLPVLLLFFRSGEKFFFNAFHYETSVQGPIVQDERTGSTLTGLPALSALMRHAHVAEHVMLLLSHYHPDCTVRSPASLTDAIHTGGAPSKSSIASIAGLNLALRASCCLRLGEHHLQACRRRLTLLCLLSCRFGHWHQQPLGHDGRDAAKLVESVSVLFVGKQGVRTVAELSAHALFWLLLAFPVFTTSEFKVRSLFLYTGLCLFQETLASSAASARSGSGASEFVQCAFV